MCTVGVVPRYYCLTRLFNVELTTVVCLSAVVGGMLCKSDKPSIIIIIITTVENKTILLVI